MLADTDRLSAVGSSRPSRGVLLATACAALNSANLGFDIGVIGGAVVFIEDDLSLPVVEVGPGDALDLASLGIRGGVGDVGGGIACEQGAVDATDVRLEGNLARRGGGLGAWECGWGPRNSRVAVQTYGPRLVLPASALNFDPAMTAHVRARVHNFLAVSH